MMSQILDVCQKLETGKVLERKKAADRLKGYLSNSDVKRRLDENSSNGPAGCSWSRVFESAASALVNEAKSYKKSQSTSGKNVEMYSLVKTVLHESKGRLRSDGYPVIYLSDLFDHICIVVNDYHHLLATEYAQILVSYFLTKDMWKNWKEPNVAQFHKLLKIFTRGLAEGLPSFNNVFVAKAIAMLSRYLSERIDFKPVMVLDDIVRCINNNQTISQQSITEYILKALNTLFEAGAVNYRYQFSQLATSSLAMRLLEIFQKQPKQSQDQVKTEIGQFFSLLIVINDDDSVPVDRSMWHEVLGELYKTLCIEISGSYKLSLRLSGSKIPSLWSKEFFQLCGEVCLLLLPEEERILEMSQVTSQARGAFLPPSKRRRVESGWKAILENILHQENDSAFQIAWLRIVYWIIKSERNDVVSDGQLTELIKVLTDLLSSTKRIAVLIELQACLTAVCVLKRSYNTTTELSWKKVISLSIHLIERSHHEFFNLLTELLKTGQLKEKQQLTSLVKCAVNTPFSEQGMTWLSHFLHQHQLSLIPLLNKNQLQLLLTDPDVEEYSNFKETWQHIWVANHLLELVYNHDEDENTDQPCQVIHATLALSAQGFATILSAIVLREAIAPRHSEKLSNAKFIDVIRMEYNAMKFQSTSVLLTRESPLDADLTPLAKVKNYVDNLLNDRLLKSKQLLQSHSSNTIDGLCSCVWFAEMVASYYNQTKNDYSDKLFNSFQEFLLMIIDKSDLQLQKRDAAKPLVSSLQSLVIQAAKIPQLLPCLSKLARSLARLADLFLDRSSSPNAFGSSDKHKRSRTDDFSDEFVQSDLAETVNSDSQESFSSTQPSNSSTSLKSEETQLLNILMCLAHIGVNEKTSRGLLLERVNKIQYTSSSRDASIVCCIFEVILTEWEDLDYVVFLSLIVHIRCIIDYYYLDPHTGVVCLNLLSQLVTAIDVSPISESHREDCGTKVVTLLKGFACFIYDIKQSSADDFELNPEFGNEYRISFVKAIGHICKVDHSEKWQELVNSSSDGASFRARLYLIKALLDRHYSVRRTAIENIHVLLYQGCKPLPSHEQESVFHLMYKEVRTILAVSGHKTPHELLEQQYTRTSSLLSLFLNIFIHSPVCSKISLCAMFLSLHENDHITVMHIRKLLSSALDKTPYKSVKEICTVNLSYIAKEWIAMEYKLADFPIALLDEHDIQIFYTRHLRSFLPFAFTSLGDHLDELATILQKTTASLFFENLSYLMLIMLPGLAEPSDSNLNKPATALLNKYSDLATSHGVEFWDLVKENLAEILKVLYKNVWSRSSQHPSEPSPNPPYHSYNQLDKIRQFLLYKLRTSSKSSSFIEILSRDMTQVSYILVHLASHMTSIKHIHELRQRYTCYSSFITNVIIPGFSAFQPSYHSFFIRCFTHVFSTTMDWLQNECPKIPVTGQLTDEEEFSINEAKLVLAKCQQKLFILYMKVDSQAVLPVIPQLTYTLTSRSITGISETAKTFLSLIWSEHREKFEHVLMDMEPINNDYQPIVQQNREFSFVQLLDMYIKSKSCNDVEVLLHIHKCLETADVFRDVTDDDGSRLLSRFIRALMDGLRRSTSTDKDDLIMSCLTAVGVLGVTYTHYNHIIDLEIFTLGQLQELESKPEHRDTVVVISYIVHYLFDNSQQVMAICDTVLAAIFGSKSGSPTEKVLSRLSERFNDLKDIICPYRTVRKRNSPGQQNLDFEGVKSMWVAVGCYDRWIRKLSALLAACCNSEFYRHLAPLCAVKREFSEITLPMFIHDLIAVGSDSLQPQFSVWIRDTIKRLLQRDENTDGVQAVKSLLNVIQYLRNKENRIYVNERVKVHTCWQNNFWLDIDYKLLTQAAIHVRNYQLAALFSEIKILQMREEEVGVDHEYLPQPLMLQIYEALDIPDMVYGWGATKLADTNSRIIHYSQDANWTRLLSARNSVLNNRTVDPVSYSLDTLKASNLDLIMASFLDAINDEDALEIRELRYQEAWSNLDWSKLPSPIRLCESLSCDEMQYMCLKSFLVDTEFFSSASKQIFHDMIVQTKKSLCNANIPSSRIQNFLRQAGCMEMLKDLRLLTSEGQLDSYDVMKKWERSFMPGARAIRLTQKELDVMEKRLVVASSLHKRSPNDVTLREFLVTSAITLSVKARQARLMQMSEQILSRFRRLNPDLWCSDCALEEAMIYWEFKEYDRAMFLMKGCMNELKPKTMESVDKCKLYSKALRTFGEWLIKTKLENLDSILENYLIPAMNFAERYRSAVEMEEAYHAIAMYTDDEYERLKAYMKSTEYQEKCSIVKVQLGQMNDILNLSHSRDTNYKRYQSSLKTHLKINEKEIEIVRGSYTAHMNQALEYHCKTMSMGSSFDLMSIFRVVAIWFENEPYSVDIKQLVKKLIPGSIPTHKFLPLLYQLAARLSAKDSDNDLQSTLKPLISKIGIDHPHHVLPVLAALVAAVTDVDADRKANPETKLRATAAKSIFYEIHKKKIRMATEYMELTTALIELANEKTDKLKKATGYQLKPTTKLLQIKDFSSTPVLTYHIKANPSGDYSDLPYVHKYETKCQFAGGVNMPKIIHCLGSDGRQYKQLCKGKDDARQDAVMQQVFGLVNELLANSQETRKLSIRTYKIVPLSQRSGLLEWCQGTVPLGTWLANTNGDYKLGAHYRYCPNLYTTDQCRSELFKLRVGRRVAPSDKILYDVYDKLCRNLPPVMRHFFFEKFPDPSRWLDSRMNYSQSTAVTCIVGYILGIGDRHTNNILIDVKTGELIHIDFGVAFEQGKALAVPETVPFRLTRDIVDGLGPTGVDGMFRRCCEKTLVVLRSSKNVIMTILQVLIDDPLLDWTLSPDKLVKLQTEVYQADNDQNSLASTICPGSQQSAASFDVNVPSRLNRDTHKHQQAQSVLLKVQHKLQGFEQNSHLSVSGQVNLLIQQARDPGRLSKMFAGWQPFL